MPMNRVGVVIGSSGGFGDTLSSLRSSYDRARASGVSSVWMTQHLGFDALTVLASLGGEEGPELGTAVVPAQPRHPVALAEQALTVQALSGGRLALGLGLTHGAVLENVYGLPSQRSVKFLEDYLATLDALLAGAKTAPNDTFTFGTRLVADLPVPPPVLIAALGHRMLQLAGRRTAGTITWMTGPKTVEAHIVPIINEAAEAAGRPSPRVIVCLPVCVTDDRRSASDALRQSMGGYRATPSYRAMLDREGVDEPADIAIVGSVDDVREAFTGLFEVGATDVVAIPSGRPEDIESTWSGLAELTAVREAGWNLDD